MHKHLEHVYRKLGVSGRAAAAASADPRHSVSGVSEARPSALRRVVERHLASRDVARVIYGAIIGLALVVALQQHPPTAAQATGAILATAVAVGLAEVYSEYVGAEARKRQPVNRAEVRRMTGEAAAVAFGAGFPAAFFILAAVGAIDLDLAYTLAKWTGLGLICLYGFAAARLAGSSRAHALLHTSALGVVAGALIALKAVLH